jgi:hypothetical protein
MIQSTSHFFVDEAGDLTILGRHGVSLLGQEGVSNCFMVGVAQIANPNQMRREIDVLRAEILSDPYFRKVPSLQSHRKKTALCFHAKDDCAEVRMAVFKLLARHDTKVIVGVRRKCVLVELAKRSWINGVRLSTDSVYDDLVKTVFKPILHKADRNVICFARRGKSTRQHALQLAISRAQRNFLRDTGIEGNKLTEIIPTVPSESVGLQVVDYYLWALQRLYERGDDRYFDFLSGHYRLIMDFDDKRCGKDYGTWYSDNNPLTKEKVLPPTG